MRPGDLSAIIVAMSDFKRLYVILSVFLLAGIGGSLVTPLGGDPRIGAFSVGLAFGVLVALTTTRIIELKIPAASGLAFLNFHSHIMESTTENTIAVPEPSSDEPALDDLTSGNAGPAQVSNILDFVISDGSLSKAEVDPIRPSESTSAALCSCACGCEWSSKGGEMDLCGNCQRWWRQQSSRCKCDLTGTESCSCGAVKHRPTSRDHAVPLAA